MRKNPTEAERQLWLLLKDRRFADYKFRRQVPIGPYIADFVCHSARLVIELDGSQHADDPRDEERTAWLKARDFTLMRLWNNQLFADRTAIADAIWSTLEENRHG